MGDRLPAQAKDNHFCYISVSVSTNQYSIPERRVGNSYKKP